MQILIVDFGSQYTEVIGCTLRDLGVRSVILSPNKAIDWLERNNKPKGIILSGGSASVNDKDAPSLSLPYFWGLTRDIPILGICYGMQWIAKYFGGWVVSDIEQKEYSETIAQLSENDILFQGLPRVFTVWASHSDTVKELPKNFHAIAFSNRGMTVAIVNPEKKLWGVQFHLEVLETQDNNLILRNFLKISEIELE